MGPPSLEFVRGQLNAGRRRASLAVVRFVYGELLGSCFDSQAFCVGFLWAVYCCPVPSSLVGPCSPRYRGSTWDLVFEGVRSLTALPVEAAGTGFLSLGPLWVSSDL
eukprot:Gb_26377 [translate_table: standard]